MNKKMDSPHWCPVCKKYEFPFHDSFEICEVCGWMDDWFQEQYPNEDHFANIMSLEEARVAYSKGEEIL